VSPRSKLALTLVGALGASVPGGGCTSPQPEPAEGRPGFAARGVELTLPAPGGQLRARADRLAIADSGAELTLEGDAAVSLDAAGGLSAKAHRLRVRPAEQRVELAGAVRARIEIRGAPDGGF